MALIHEKLYQSNNLAQINLQDYIHTLNLNLLKSYPVYSCIALTVHGSDRCISIAIACGLIINELVSNALRHAFPYSHSGQIQVILTAEEADTQVLTVQDNGIGLPSNLDLLTTNL